MRILKSGISTIQDHGRFGYRNQGIPQSGSMDQLAARLGNLLVGNDDDAACLEISRGSLTASFGHTCLIALTGSGYEAYISGRPIDFWQPVLIKQDEFLQLYPVNSGFTYLSVHGGVRSQINFGSRSTHIGSRMGGINGQILQPGDHLPITHLPEASGQRIMEYLSRSSGPHQLRLSPSVIPDYTNSVLRLIPGPEFNIITPNSRKLLETESFSVSTTANRMGYRLIGPVISKTTINEFLSQPVMPGTIQVSPDGQLFLLQADAQTTGGYPRIAQVAAVDLHIAAQKGPESLLNFRFITLEESEDLLLKREKQLIQLKRDYNLYFT